MRGTRKIDGKQYTAYASGTKASMTKLAKSMRKDNPKIVLSVLKSWRATEPGKYILYVRN